MSAKKHYTVCTECGLDEPSVKFPASRSKASGRCLDCQSKRNKEWYKNYGQNWFLGKAFGMTAEDYERMAAEQGHLCLICHCPETATDARTGAVRRLSVDHDHATGKVRGLLCRACNQGLGSFRDNPDRMRIAALYVEKNR